MIGSKQNLSSISRIQQSGVVTPDQLTSFFLVASAIGLSFRFLGFVVHQCERVSTSDLLLRSLRLWVWSLLWGLTAPAMPIWCRCRDAGVSRYVFNNYHLWEDTFSKILATEVGNIWGILSLHIRFDTAFTSTLSLAESGIQWWSTYGVVCCCKTNCGGLLLGRCVSWLCLPFTLLCWRLSVKKFTSVRFLFLLKKIVIGHIKVQLDILFLVSQILLISSSITKKSFHHVYRPGNK